MSGAGGRVVHQDYIVRQRYSNALPPPPGAPKLLDIPLNGMATYTMPVYTERMLKAQPLNIEADAFLGMPIDLVGMPGIFEGDESSIQAPLVTPPVHPRDRLLLRPLKSLGKPKSELNDISFLRRTQYVAEDRIRIENVGRGPTGQIKRRRIDTSKEDPTHILRSTIKGFDVANPESAYTGPDNQSNIRGLTASFAETEAWKNPKHPTKPNLKMLDSYPLIPDLSALTEDPTGGYAVLKFIGNPTEITDRYDERLEGSILRSLDIDPEIMREFQQKLEAHKEHPDRHPAPALPTVNYDFFLPLTDDLARGIKRKRNVLDPDRDSTDLYTDMTEGATENDCFKLKNVRKYESGLQQNFSDTPYQEVAIALHDPGSDEDTLQKAAYFYPVAAKTQLKVKRAAKLAHIGQSQLMQEAEEKIDHLAVQYRDQNEEETELRAELLAQLEGREVEVGA